MYLSPCIVFLHIPDLMFVMSFACYVYEGPSYAGETSGKKVG